MEISAHFTSGISIFYSKQILTQKTICVILAFLYSALSEYYPRQKYRFYNRENLETHYFNEMFMFQSWRYKQVKFEMHASHVFDGNYRFNVQDSSPSTETSTSGIKHITHNALMLNRNLLLPDNEVVKTHLLCI